MPIEKEIADIKIRNSRVEADKAWEKSFTRRGFISVMTYLIAFVWLLMIHDTVPYLKAIVPVLGYILSTLSLPIIKKDWVKNYGKN